MIFFHEQIATWTDLALNSETKSLLFQSKEEWRKWHLVCIFERLIGRVHFGVVCHEILIITPGSIIRDVPCSIITTRLWNDTSKIDICHSYIASEILLIRFGKGNLPCLHLDLKALAMPSFWPEGIDNAFLLTWSHCQCLDNAFLLSKKHCQCL